MYLKSISISRIFTYHGRVWNVTPAMEGDYCIPKSKKIRTPQHFRSHEFWIRDSQPIAQFCNIVQCWVATGSTKHSWGEVSTWGQRLSKGKGRRHRNPAVSAVWHMNYNLHFFSVNFDFRPVHLMTSLSVPNPVITRGLPLFCVKGSCLRSPRLWIQKHNSKPKYFYTVALYTKEIISDCLLQKTFRRFMKNVLLRAATYTAQYCWEAERQTFPSFSYCIYFAAVTPSAPLPRCSYILL